MFLDQVYIEVKAGDGGSGASSFRREKFIAKGGPDGGDGGNGGDIILRVDINMSTLIDFHYRPHYKAENGVRGGSKKAHGKNAPTKILRIPPGTCVYDEDGNLIADLVTDGAQVVVACGGRGGRGNASFMSNRNKAPRLYEKGEAGGACRLRLDLKLIADVGLVGFPNVGKSTILSVITDAHPKIASYPFTTIKPNLGVVVVDEFKRFVIADLPGLIEGAHSGIGLGDQFLKHVERTRLLIQVIDPSNMEGRDWLEEYQIISQELSKYSKILAERPKIIVINKIDITEVKEMLPKIEKDFKKKKLAIFAVSAATGEGLKEVIYAVSQMLEKIPKARISETPVKRKVFQIPFRLARQGKIYIITGKEPDKWVQMTDFNNTEARQRLDRIFNKLGINQALEDAGIQEGDTIQVSGREFVYTRY